MNQSDASSLINGLFESWGPTLVRFAFRLCGRREAAEDSVQEAFLALYRELRGGGRIENPKGWTLRVVRNQILKLERNRKRWGEDVDTSALDRLPAREWRIDEPPDDPARKVVELFDVLTPREDEVLVLRFQAMKYREIAAQLDLSVNHVGVLLDRALKKLKAARKARAGGSAVEGLRWMDRNVPETLQ
ncbi:MAG: sigma-70 family RNA polymerase sigma factor [bacterium]|nr:sigma-70 family RNA polymerase sigma factor [bacterium]